MDETKQKRHNEVLQVLRPRLITRYGSLTLIVIIISTFAIFREEIRQDIPLYELMCLIIPAYAVIISAFFLVSGQKIFVYKDGIEHHYGNRQSFVPWEDMSHFEARKVRRKTRKGIVTHRMIRDNKLGGTIERFARTFDDVYFLVLDDFVKIPGDFRNVDVDEFRRTELGKLLNEYAPHLFDNTK